MFMLAVLGLLFIRAPYPAVIMMTGFKSCADNVYQSLHHDTDGDGKQQKAEIEDKDALIEVSQGQLRALQSELEK
eukprot:1751680-Rhodomonas_salina.1